LNPAAQPPPLPRARSTRLAVSLGFVFPGVGHFCQRRWLAGTLYALAFASCFVFAIAGFLQGYRRYLELSTGDVLSGDHLEELSHAFPAGRLLGLVALAIAVYIASLISLLYRSRS
jgi:hypothetical protein